MINDKQQVLTTLREEFNRWEELLAGLSEEQITAPRLPANWSIKDEIAHLKAWQQRTNARMEAAMLDKEPEFPKWPAGLDPEAQGQPHEVNAWIYETHRDQPWSGVHREWRAGFQKLLESGEAIPEKDLLDATRYPWLEGNPLSIFLMASYEHHHEHLEELLAWLAQHGNTKPAG